MTDQPNKHGVSSLGERLQSAVDHSLLGRTLAPITERASRAQKRLTTIVRGSYCYRWLTKEPDPAVIVIDLRETYTVGPLIALLDSMIPQVKRAWTQSYVGSLVGDLCERLSETVFEPVSETRGYELLVSILTLPEPPAKNPEPDENAKPADDTS